MFPIIQQFVDTRDVVTVHWLYFPWSQDVGSKPVTVVFSVTVNRQTESRLVRGLHPVHARLNISDRQNNIVHTPNSDGCFQCDIFRTNAIIIYSQVELRAFLYNNCKVVGVKSLGHRSVLLKTVSVNSRNHALIWISTPGSTSC